MKTQITSLTVVLVVLVCLALVEGKALESRGKRSADKDWQEVASNCNSCWHRFGRELIFGNSGKYFWNCIYMKAVKRRGDDDGKLGDLKSCFETQDIWMTARCSECLEDEVMLKPYVN